ncbi:MAG: cytochrome c oxidase assembly protein [Micrococcales bacterium]|nr:cytochrome c oxidase assembly protein [Micrococcales bacterium]
MGPVAHGGAKAAGPSVMVLGVAVVALGYAVLAVRAGREVRGWSGWRTASFLTGCVVVAIALTPQLTPFPHGDFRGHMLQHLLAGMYGPLGLVLGAPLTLFLRSVSARTGRRAIHVLRSRPARLLANPLTALALNLGGLAALYFTPLYDVLAGVPALHLAVHVHFLAAGYLFAWVIAGPDPGPHRPGVPARLVILGVAIAGHAVLSQLLYAGAFVQVQVPPMQLRGGADLMYYGGDIAELLLAFALVTSWRPRPRPRPRRTSDHRGITVGPAAP